VLVHKLCAPLTGQPGSLKLYGNFAVATSQAGAFLERCGSTQKLEIAPLVFGQPLPFLGGNDNEVLACDVTTGQYEGWFLPSLKRFTFSLPAQFSHCTLQLGANSLYVPGPTGYWTAQIPTTPPRPPRRQHR
jgi:hypothetical protein